MKKLISIVIPFMNGAQSCPNHFFSQEPTFSSVQSLSCVQLFATPWTTACQASLSITNSWSGPKLMCIESVMPSNHLILYRLLLLLPSIFPSIRVVSNESVLHIRWPKDWSFRLDISPSSDYSRLCSFRIDWFDLAVQVLSRVFSKTTVQKHYFSIQPSLMLGFRLSLAFEK